MVTAICVFAICFWAHKLMKAAPGAIKFGLENQDALRGGASVLKRMFRK